MKQSKQANKHTEQGNNVVEICGTSMSRGPLSIIAQVAVQSAVHRFKSRKPRRLHGTLTGPKATASNGLADSLGPSKAF